ncbi:hypothetical protein OIU34_22290 [Pararhizobium sp. BT-229]|uniref:cobaltochelatase CobT-related protein n=1 Tax=Pararhizobium sp. BT-229 TaxID=2986923 RepID=UPI0021F78D3A|nr:hypothetical protein [Pararhizobium sp. BT-229]MCV9964624.1 hypothetical protein [Pararhizobium sp. BT-229]
MDFAEVARQTGYSIFTAEFDRVRNVRDDFGPEMLEQLRQQVETHQRTEYDRIPSENDAAALEEAVAELEAVLRTALEETGVQASSSVIAFLVDNSGSLRDMGAVFARAMSRVCRVLDGFGFDTPVVGHTTSQWKGGKSKVKWIESGRPMKPGRLNDILFTVYKEPGEPTVDGDNRLYGLAASREFKENIDGEALAWTALKVDELEVANKSIVFVSDGDISMDDASVAYNDRDFLDRHRSAVIAEIEASDIGLVHVVASRDKVAAPVTGVPTFGGGEVFYASELVRSITQAIDHAIRMNAAPKPVAGVRATP